MTTPNTITEEYARCGAQLYPSFLPHEEALASLDFFMQPPTRSIHAFVVGPCGSGKTAHLRAIKRMYDFTSDRISFITTTELVARAADYGPTTIIETYGRGRLIIDDIGMRDDAIKHYGNEFKILDELAFIRYEYHQPTYFTTNVPSASLHKIFSERTWARYRNAQIFIFKKQKYR